MNLDEIKSALDAECNPVALMVEVDRLRGEVERLRGLVKYAERQCDDMGPFCPWCSTDAMEMRTKEPYNHHATCPAFDAEGKVR